MRYLLTTLSLLTLTACTSTNTITEKVYDTDGNLTKETVTECVVSDMSALLNAEPDDITATIGYINTFSIGVTGWGGISSTEVEIIRVKVPMDPANYSESTVKSVIEQISKLVEKTKSTVTVTTEGLTLATNTTTDTNTTSSETTTTTTPETETFDVLASVKEKRKEKNKD